MQYILSGFSQAMGIRIFSFEGIAEDRTRTVFTVMADLALTRSYDIRLQELPLLCREVLDRRGTGDENRTFTYTEEDMRAYSHDRAALQRTAAQKRKSQGRLPQGTSESVDIHSGEVNSA